MTTTPPDRAAGWTAILFDLGGTLLRSEDPEGWAALARSVGLPIDPEPLGRAARAIELELDAADGPPPPFEEFWQRVLERTRGAPVPLVTARAFTDRYRSASNWLPAYPDVRPCLDRLASDGWTLGVVSNSGHPETTLRSRLAAVGIGSFFSVVLSSHTEGVRKPDPEIFRRAVARLGRAPPEVVYLGDLRRTDALAARAAGLHGIWLDRQGIAGGSDPPKLSSLAELVDYVGRPAVARVI